MKKWNKVYRMKFRTYRVLEKTKDCTIHSGYITFTIDDIEYIEERMKEYGIIKYELKK